MPYDASQGGGTRFQQMRARRAAVPSPAVQPGGIGSRGVASGPGGTIYGGGPQVQPGGIGSRMNPSGPGGYLQPSPWGASAGPAVNAPRSGPGGYLQPQQPSPWTNQAGGIQSRVMGQIPTGFLNQYQAANPQQQQADYGAFRNMVRQNTGGGMGQMAGGGQNQYGMPFQGYGQQPPQGQMRPYMDPFAGGGQNPQMAQIQNAAQMTAQQQMEEQRRRMMQQGMVGQGQFGPPQLSSISYGQPQQYSQRQIGGGYGPTQWHQMTPVGQGPSNPEFMNPVYPGGGQLPGISQMSQFTPQPYPRNPYGNNLDPYSQNR